MSDCYFRCRGGDLNQKSGSALVSFAVAFRITRDPPRPILDDVIARIGPHPAGHLADFLPYNWPPLRTV